MPTYVVTDPNTGRKVKLTGDTPPTDEDLDEIFSSLPAPKQAEEAKAPTEEKKSLRQKAGDIASGVSDFIEPFTIAGQVKGAADAVLGNELSPTQKVGAEFAGAVNRGTSKLADFAASLPNAVLQLADSDKQIPSLTNALSGATAGNFMEPGLGRDVTRSAGEVIPAAVTGGALLRGAAQTVPAFAESGVAAAPLASQSLGANVMRQVGTSTIGQDALYGALSGGGAKVGETAGRSVGGETGAQVGSFVGSLATPLAALAGAGAVRNTASRLSGSARPAPIIDDIPLASSADDAAREIPQAVPEPVANMRRQRVFDDLDLTPTEAQRTRDTDLFVRQQDAFRRGGPVREALERQEEILDMRTRGELAAMGGRAEAAAITPIEAINAKAIQLDDEISSLYRAARDAAPGQKNIKFSRAAVALRENNPIDTRTDGTVSALREEMKRLGFLDSKGAPTSRTSVEAAENLRKYANSLYDGANPLARGVIRDFKNALDDDVLSVAGEDVFRQARSAKANFERGLSTETRNKFDKRQVSLVRDILDNTVTEDQLAKKVINRASKYGRKDVEELRDYLLNGTPGQVAQGQQAWNDIRAAAFNQIREKSFKGPVTQSGTQSLSRSGIESALKEIGPQKFEVLFTPTEQQFIRRLAAVSALKEPPPGTFTGSGPSSPAIQKLEETLGRIPVFGGFARDISQDLRNRATDRRILTLTDDLERIARQNEREAARMMKEAENRGSIIKAPLIEATNQKKAENEQ